MEILNTNRLILRTMNENDFEPLYKNIFIDVEVTKHTFGSSNFSFEECAKFLKENGNFSNKLGLSVIVEKSTNKIIGLAGVLECEYLTNKDYEIGFILERDSWGKGYAKEFIEIKEDGRIIVPELFKTNLLENLEEYDLKLSEFDFVVVRNSIGLLKEVLKQKNRYDFKVGFRLSFPKRIAKLQTDEANNKKSLFDVISNKIQTYSEINLINECDIFLPTSFKMKNDYFKDVKTRTFVIPSAIDPDNLNENIQHEGKEKRFFYAGTLDKLREFETVLKAFSKLDNSDYKIFISTKDPEYLDSILSNFSNLKDNIKIFEATTRKDLLNLIAIADIGLSALPDIALFNSSTPMKVLDYYSSAIPCIMSKNENNSSIFEDNDSAWFCDFNENSIKEKLEHIISLSKEEITQVGLNGQKRLLAVRNYERIAADLAHQLNIL